MKSKQDQKYLKLSSNPFKVGFEIWWWMILFQSGLAFPFKYYSAF
ncbi:hypothetical protein AVDCRST_MAG81-4004 [uncultured Synechococcales cyanobacterium]|uniref:Uncharacterized protein n=1 Tax=uncultured Synechococcales cyanobacterium TaxID=1936017 RepID=A0A6J4VSN4_9CYAN|nr:hypothetical protein AVDCRST_MAG81-4004 [uncultured Synechococcales cyanobacterium]